jgi:membrane-bound lytic murein transglycosylase B
MLFKINNMKVLTSLLLAVLLSSSCSTGRLQRDEDVSRAISSLPHTDLTEVDYAYSELIKNGVSEEFAKKLEAQFLKEKKNFENRDKIVQLNVLGFLTPGDYSKHYSANAVKQVKKFIKRYGKTLSKVEREFNIPKEIIASLLWVETKHGKTLGTFHIPMVYYSLMQATHPQVAKTTLTELNFRKPSSNSAAASLSYAELQQKVILRLTKKSAWALEQIKTLEQISQKRNASGKHMNSILTTRSSFAGAFGCSQFIPSSYEKYAISPSNKSPNLFEMKDCIYSVANFLHQNGWDSQSTKAQSDALFEYNRIRDYGDVIQRIAADARS